MTFDIRMCASPQEFADAFMAIGQYFGSEEAGESFTRNLPLERTHAAFDEGRVVGGAGAFPFELSVPGGWIPCAGVTIVGVHPTHRRRGALRGLMRAQLDAVHERGEPIAALWASEETIYGRFGYGLASWHFSVDVPREYAAFTRPLERLGTSRLVEAEEARSLFPRVWDALLAQRPGVFTRTPDWWETRIVADPSEWRNGAGPKRFVVLEREGDVRAYAIYRHRAKFEDGVSVGSVVVNEAIGADAQATAELWRYLLDIDWTATVSATFLPPDHPLFLLVASPRRLRARRADALWVRVVDVPSALAGRSYGSDEQLVFELADAFCPWNEGRWRLAAGTVERTEDEPDLRFDAEALGSAYLGGITFRELAETLRVDEVREGTVARADRLFRSPVHPWCPEIF